MSKTVITFGTFDVFHVGHLRVIERAAALGDRLVVGVSADALNERKKGRAPVHDDGTRSDEISLDEIDINLATRMGRCSRRGRAHFVLSAEDKGGVATSAKCGHSVRQTVGK